VPRLQPLESGQFDFPSEFPSRQSHDSNSIQKFHLLTNVSRTGQLHYGLWDITRLTIEEVAPLTLGHQALIEASRTIIRSILLRSFDLSAQINKI
jgi:hypothetical protein